MAEVEEYHGSLNATGLKIAIVVARFNELVNQQLLQGALDCLTRHGVKEADIKVFWVPGAFEIPQVASVIAQRSHFDGMIAIGTVIRGATPHFEYVAGSAVTGISQVALQNNLPITFGILTTETIEQAIERAGTKAGNKGWDAALALIETINVIKNIK